MSARSGRSARPVIVLLLALATALTMGLVALPQQAVAAPVTDFDPGFIMSDSVMNDAGAMTAGQIQAFFNDKGASCRPTAGNTCLKDYRESTPTRPADALCRGGYAAGLDETAATIIAKVSAACGINPQVLIVTLQKEQGLVTSTAGKSSATYQRALGFGCPDNVGGWCDPKYAGFANQIFSAAQQLQRYAANPNNYAYRAGRANTVMWHPNAACGTSSVYIQNQATASLYNYTPYRPNAAALAAGFGTGDACSSYGNRNFHLYFQQWFGSAKQTAPPRGNVEGVTLSGTVATISGWAFDPDTTESIAVHVYVDGVAAVNTVANGSRPDVGAAFNRGNFHGFTVSVNLSGGVHSICVYGINVPADANPNLGCREVGVANTTPIGNVEGFSTTADSVSVSGWALDPDTRESIPVHLYLDGVGARSITADVPRRDVDAIHKKGELHGFNATLPVSPGAHTVCAYAINSPAGFNPQIGCKSFEITNSLPVGNFEAVTPRDGMALVAGWTFDIDTSSSIAVHAYVNGQMNKIFVADANRPDVGRVHNRGSAHGFGTLLSVPSGTSTVCLYAINAPGGFNPSLGCRSVTVVNNAPTGRIEAVVGANGAVSVSGWAFDSDTRDPITLSVSLDGVAVRDIVADIGRLDVDQAFNNGPLHGFATSIFTTPGAHEVCVTAKDSSGGPSTSLGCGSTVLADTPPVGELTTVTPDAGSLTVAGWAYDYDTSASVTIETTIDGVPAPKKTSTGLASTVANPRSGATTTGYEQQHSATAGNHTVCTSAVDSLTGSKVGLGCKAVTVANTPPRSNLEGVSSEPGILSLSGWAFDVDTPAPVRIDVYLTNTQTGAATVTSILADLPRSDVDAYYGAGPNRGFTAHLPVAAGTYELCAYAINVPDGANPVVGLWCSRVTVP